MDCKEIEQILIPQQVRMLQAFDEHPGLVSAILLKLGCNENDIKNINHVCSLSCGVREMPSLSAAEIEGSFLDIEDQVKNAFDTYPELPKLLAIHLGKHEDEIKKNYCMWMKYGPEPTQRKNLAKASAYVQLFYECLSKIK